jgi:hypothetical protein
VIHVDIQVLYGEFVPGFPVEIPNNLFKMSKNNLLSPGTFNQILYQHQRIIVIYPQKQTGPSNEIGGLTKNI